VGGLGQQAGGGQQAHQGGALREHLAAVGLHGFLLLIGEGIVWVIFVAIFVVIVRLIVLWMDLVG
jgi:hypothetical protein